MLNNIVSLRKCMMYVAMSSLISPTRAVVIIMLVTEHN